MSKVVIVGAGPAGITAAIYLKRGGIEPILIEKMMPGGKVSLTHKVDNYPGFSSIGGSDLANEFMNQLMANNIEIVFDEVTKITKLEDGFNVKTSYNEYQADAVIVATGTVERKLGIPGEKEFFAKGVSSCAVCVHRRNEFRADQILVDRIKKDDHIEILTPFIPLEVKGDNMVSSLVLKNVETNEEKEISINAMFAYVGADANTSFIDIKGLLDDKGYIVVDSEMTTSIPGLFACGDCIKKNLRQVVTACGDGAIAAMSCVHYLNK